MISSLTGCCPLPGSCGYKVASLGPRGQGPLALVLQLFKLAAPGSPYSAKLGVSVDYYMAPWVMPVTSGANHRPLEYLVGTG